MRLIRLDNGWTGGQYSLARAAFGLWLLGWWVIRNEPPLLITAGAAAALALVVGWWARAALAVLALLVGRRLLEQTGLLPEIACLVTLALLLGLRQDPFGSLAARGRSDPGGGWRFDSGVFALWWALLVVGHAYEGARSLLDPVWRGVVPRAGGWLVPAVQLGFAVAAPFPRLRPWAWNALVLTILSAAVLTPGVGPNAWIGLLFLHAFAFDPAWVRPKRDGGGPARLYYDGSCGLCHRAVRFCLAEDREGETLRYAPLQGETFAREVPAERRGALPDSLVLQEPDGSLHVRSEAVLRIGTHLGGLWRLLAAAARIVPRPLRDLIYDRVAAVRLRLFPRPDATCPLVPPDLGARCDA